MADTKHSVPLEGKCTRIGGDAKVVELQQLGRTPPASMVETKHTPVSELTHSEWFKIETLQQCLSVILRSFCLFGFQSEGYELGKTLSHWMALCRAVPRKGPDTVSRVVKYKLAAWFASHVSQPVPPAPFQGVEDKPGVLLGGKAMRWQRIALSPKNQDRFEFLHTVKKCGRGMPRPPIEMVRQKERETEAQLTTARPAPERISLYGEQKWGDADALWLDQKRGPKSPADFYCMQSTMISQIRRTVEEALGDAKYDMAARVRCFIPSTSAHYVSSRTQGGALGALLVEHRDLFQGLRRPFSGLRVVTGEVKEEEERQSEHKVHLDVTDTAGRFATLYGRILTAAVSEVPSVEVLGLAEAQKVRVITKGPPLLNTALRPLQRFLWEQLKDHPCFSLVGRPIDWTYVQARLGVKLRDDEKYLSGDLQDATTNFHGWVSEAVGDAIADRLGLTEEERVLLLRGLTGHVFPTGRQRTGQLMGSVISFPILCIANAAFTRYALEQASGRHYSLRDAPMFINGDDMACRTTELGYRMWQRLMAFMGPPESMGKTFFTREFVEANSTLFLRRDEPLEHEDWSSVIGSIRAGLTPAVARVGPQFFEQVYSVNMGLFYGQKRSGGTVGLADFTDDGREGSISTRAHDMVRGLSGRLRNVVMTSFVLEHSELLGRFRVPWFMPRWMGGVGLPSYWNVNTGSFCGPTILDLKKGAAIWTKHGPLSTHGRTAWRLHEWQVKMAAAWPKSHSPLSLQSRKLSDAAASYQAVDLLFDSRFELDDFFVRPPRDPAKAAAQRAKQFSDAIRKCERVWERAQPFPKDAFGRFRELITSENPPGESPEIPIHIDSISSPQELWTSRMIGAAR